jgi:hypothetical protein
MRKIAIVSLIISLITLSGCAFSDPRISGTPPRVAMEEAFTVNLAESAEELQLAWASVAALREGEPGQEKWAAMAETLESLWLVMVGPDPINRVPAINVDIGDPAPFDNIESAKTSAESALTLASQAHVARAQSSNGMEALLWASVAASLSQVRTGIAGPYANPVVGFPSTTVTITSDDEALNDLIISYDEAVFALRTSLGFLSPDLKTQFAAIATTWERELEQLMVIAGERNLQPDAVAIYALPPGRDDAAGMRLLVSSQQSIIQSAAVWVASADDPSAAMTYLLSSATVTSDLGVGCALWPGFPDPV